MQLLFNILQAPSWTPIGAPDKDGQDATTNDLDDDIPEHPSSSDAELEYARVHGVTGLSRVKVCVIYIMCNCPLIVLDSVAPIRHSCLIPTTVS